MNNILQLAAFFLAQLGFGSAVIIPFLPIKEVGKSFLRFYYGFIVITLALFLLCLYRLGQFNLNYLIICSLAAWIWALSFAEVFTKLEEYLLWVYGLFSIFILVIYAEKYFFHGSDWLQLILPMTSILVATLFLAFGVLNMIFGHWYLVNRTLNIKHLITSSKNFLILTYVRALFCGLAVYYAYRTLDATHFDRIIDFMGHGIFFWARILAGLGIPLLVAHLSYESAKIGSNQSATGIMYAGSVFVLMGELMVLYLFSLTGIFF